MDRLSSVVVLKDGDIVASGRSKSFSGKAWDGWITRVTQDGKEVWRRNYGGTNDDGFVSLTLTSDDGLILGGWSERSTNENDDAWILRTDLLGNPQWETKWGDPGIEIVYDLVEVDGGGIVAVGNIAPLGVDKRDGLILKLDRKGKVLWSNSIGGDGDDRFYSVSNLSDGNVAVAGARAIDDKAYDGWFVAFDNKGKIISDVGIDAQSEDRLYDVVKTGNNHLMFSGFSRSATATSSEGWLLDVDYTIFKKTEQPTIAEEQNLGPAYKRIILPKSTRYTKIIVDNLEIDWPKDLLGYYIDPKTNKEITDSYKQFVISEMRENYLMVDLNGPGVLRMQTKIKNPSSSSFEGNRGQYGR